MLTASCFFRGNYMTAEAAESLLGNLCAVPELTPEYWNIFEPINVPFRRDNVLDVISALTPSPSIAIRTLVFFVRRKAHTFLLTIDLSLAPFQGSTPHNRIIFDECSTSEKTLTQYLPTSVLPRFPDYASIPDWEQDKERYKEFKRSYGPREFVEMLSKPRPVTAPFGPYGCLADVQWFNYFGRVYVEAIGKARLLGAGWEHVEEVGDGLACYATKNLDDRDSRERRSRIAKAIEEFVWTPGCKREEKKIPHFDFSEQLSALPSDLAAKANQTPDVTHVHFAGLSAEEQEEALRLLERAGARLTKPEKP
jgi:hypothetical protein